MKLGFIDLSKEKLQLEKEIDRLLKNNWLDHLTYKEFVNSKMKSFHSIEKLKELENQIQDEIEYRQKTWGA